jgi:hypothetical protein
MQLGHRDADPGSRDKVRGTPTPARQAGIDESVVTAARLLPLNPPSVKRAHLDRRPTGLETIFALILGMLYPDRTWPALPIASASGKI